MHCGANGIDKKGSDHVALVKSVPDHTPLDRVGAARASQSVHTTPHLALHLAIHLAHFE